MQKKSLKQSSQKMRDLLPNFLDQLNKNIEKQPGQVIKAWPKLIGEKLAPLTEVLRFEEGVLVVKVKNATLYSLLSQHEKKRLLNLLQKHFSDKIVRDLIFRIG